MRVTVSLGTRVKGKPGYEDNSEPGCEDNSEPGCVCVCIIASSHTFMHR